MNILIYEPYLSVISGNTRTIQALSGGLEKSSYKIILAVPIHGPFSQFFNSMGVKCEVIEAPEVLKKYGRQLLANGVVGKLRTIIGLVSYTQNLFRFIRKNKINENKINVIQCNSLRSILTIGFAAKLARVRTLLYVNTQNQHKLLTTVGFMLADMIAFQCEELKNNTKYFYPSCHKRKFRILKNSIDLNEIIKAENSDKSKLKLELNVQDGFCNICCASRIVPDKGLEYLLESFSQVLGEGYKCKLYLVGDIEGELYAEYKDSLIKLVDKLGVGSHVIFTGFRKDVLEVLSLMDAYVLPSLLEGVSKSVMEAMALGKPVVCTDVGGMSSIVKNNDTGFLVSPRDVLELKQAMVKLVDNKELRKKLGQAAKAKMFAEHSFEQHVQGLKTFYEELSLSK